MKQYQLFKKLALLLCVSLLSMPMLFSQSKITVSGTVTDVDKLPVIGASVMQAGTTNGTSTDADGNFSITVPTGSELEFSSVGFQSKTLKAEANMEVVLVVDAQFLEETVVVGYGVQKRESLTSSISQIRSEEITNTKTDNAVVALQGKIPGLMIREQNGRPGQFNADLSLRGYGTPMIVVDGVVRSTTMTRKFGDREGGMGWMYYYASGSPNMSATVDYNDISVLQEINPEDIESISVLKDASATIYGLGATNGVILITTKKGRVQKPSISFTTSFAASEPVINRKVEDWVSFMRWENQMSDVAKMAHRFSPELIAGYENGDPNLVYTDWYEACYKKFSLNQNHNVTLSGGNETVNYYFGLGYSKTGSILRSDNIDYDRYNFNASVNVNFSKNLSARYNAVFRQSTSKALGDFDDDWNIFYYMYASNPMVKPTTQANPSHWTDVEEHCNPLAMLDAGAGYQITDMKQYNNTLDITYTAPFLKGLKFSATGAYDYTRNKTRNLIRQYNLYDYYTDLVSGISRKEASYNEMWADNTRLYGRVQATYDTQIAHSHNISVMIGAEMTNTKNANVNAYRKYGSTQDDSFYTHDVLNQAVATTGTNNGTRNEIVNAGYIGRLAYNYKGKYIVELMGRYDGAYQYAPGHRWGFFPSYSLGYRISEEQWFKNLLPFVNNLKVRWSDGNTGSVQGAAYAYLSGYTASGSWVMEEGKTTTGYNNTTTESTILTWAKVRMQDVGLDWELWKGKFGGTFDWYRREIRGLAGTPTVDIPDFYGVSIPQQNLNRYENQGVELQLTHRNSIGDFSYRIAANASYTRGRMTYDFAEPTKTYSSSMNYWQSYSIGRWQGWNGGQEYHWSGGQFTSLNDIANTPVLYESDGNRSLIVGQYKIEDRNGDGYINNADMYYTWSDSNPPLHYGFNFSGNYKNFDFSFVFAGSALKRKSLGINGQYSGFGKLNYLPSKYTDSYHVKEYGADPWDPNTEWVSGYWPALVRLAQSGSSPNSTYAANQPYQFINAAYMRLKSVELGYRFSPKFLQIVGIRNARVYINAGNLFTICNPLIKDVDPEATDNQRSGGTFPINRTYSLGLNLNF